MPYHWLQDKRANLKTGVTRKQRSPNCSEKRLFLTPWYAPVCVRIRGYEMFVFQKIWRAFSCNTNFEILPFLYYQIISAKLWLILKALIFLIQSESHTDELYWEPEFYRVNLIYVNIVTKIAHLNITSTNTFN